MKIVKNKHIGAYGVIIQDEKIVLAKKARGGYLGKLDLPGGGIEHTETAEVALKREIKEEAGLDIVSYELLDAIATNITWQMDDKTIEDLHHFGILYKVKATGKLKKEPDGLDSNGASWYEIDKLRKSNLTPFTIYSLEKCGYQINN